MARSKLILCGITTATVLGLTAATPSVDPAHVAAWPQFGRAASHPGNAPAETAFTPDTIGGLEIAWKGQLTDASTDKGGAAVVGGFAYASGDDGVLSVFAADGCGSDVCQPSWKGITDGGIFGTPAVVGDVVFVGSSDHFLYAFPTMGCGQATCAPRWRGQLQSAALESSPAVVDGMAYLGDYSGRLYAFDVSGCSSPICAPVWVGRARPHEQFVSSPAVANGHVYIGTFFSTPDLVTGRLLAFGAAGCAANARAECEPEWSARLRGPVAGNTAPLVAGDTVYAASTTRFGAHADTEKHLFAFAASGCDTVVCKPLRTYQTDDLGVVGGPAISGDTLYASVQASPRFGTIGAVAAYPAAGCGHRRCLPIWTGLSQANGSESPPVVTGGLVLVAEGPASGFPVDAAVLSYPADGCGAEACNPLSFTQTGLEQFFNGAPLTVAAGTIFMLSSDSTSASYLYALKVGA